MLKFKRPFPEAVLRSLHSVRKSPLGLWGTWLKISFNTLRHLRKTKIVQLKCNFPNEPWSTPKGTEQFFSFFFHQYHVCVEFPFQTQPCAIFCRSGCTNSMTKPHLSGIEVLCNISTYTKTNNFIIINFQCFEWEHMPFQFYILDIITHKKEHHVVSGNK